MEMKHEVRNPCRYHPPSYTVNPLLNQGGYFKELFQGSYFNRVRGSTDD